MNNEGETSALSPETVAATRQMSLTIERLYLTRSGHPVSYIPGFTLLPGALLFVVGRNGVGKTTLLRRICSFLSSSGIVTYGTDRDKEICPYIAYLGHKKALALHQTVETYLTSWAMLQQGDSRAALEPCLRFWGLEPFRKITLAALSAGWLQRVALARLMMLNEKYIWLLDEPTSALDQDGKERLMQAICGRCYTGGVTIMTSHEDPEQLAQYAYLPYRVLNMNDFSA